MKRFVLDHLNLACQTSSHVVRCSPGASGADLYVDLDTGKTVAIYVVNRAIRVPEIRETVETNTSKKIHTLFIVDGRMMPKESADIEPPHWMDTLHALAHGRIYAYWCDGRRCTIRAIHMDWKWGGSPRTVTYGPPVSLNDLRTNRIECATKFIEGSYAIADFNDAQFWKKRDPAGDRQFKYSWRHWSYGSKRSSAHEADEQQSEWDPWETFSRNYAEAENTSWEYENVRSRKRRQRTDDRTRSTGSTYISAQQHYAMLGVPATASFEEVKVAYRRKAREYHPDLHPPNEKEKYTAKMADINAAFEAISKRLKQA